MKEKSKENLEESIKIKKSESLSKRLKKELGYTTCEGREVQEFIYEFQREGKTVEPKKADVVSTDDEGR